MGPVQVTHQITYTDYIQKCAHFAPNVISVLFLSKMNKLMKDPKEFRK